MPTINNRMLSNLMGGSRCAIFVLQAIKSVIFITPQSPYYSTNSTIIGSYNVGTWLAFYGTAIGNACWPVAPLRKSTMIFLTELPDLYHIPVHPQRREFEKIRSFLVSCRGRLSACLWGSPNLPHVAFPPLRDDRRKVDESRHCAGSLFKLPYNQN